MKHKFLLLIVTFTLVFASIASAQNTKDFAHGNGQIEFEGKVSNFSFTAQRQKDGTVKGRLINNQRSATNPESNLSVQMDIDCLTIVGNTATIQGIITKADPESVFVEGFGDFSLIGAAAVMTVTDGGNEGDTASPLIITGARSTFCTEQFPADTYRTTNVVVRSGSSL